MNVKAEVESSTIDTVKLLSAVFLIVAGIGAFYYFENYSTLLRVLGLLIIAGVSVAVALQSVPGQQVWNFAVAARAEVRKVVWPSRQETIQTTLIVFLMVLLIGVMLWLFDMALMAIVRAVTG